MGPVTSSKPTILLVPGAWHVHDCFTPMTEVLEAEGYKCVGINLPSVSWSMTGRPTPMDFNEDIETIRSNLEQLLDAGEDVLLWLHSYAGIPGQSACKGLDKMSRAQQGKKGGLIKVVFCASFALPEGMCLVDMLGDNPTQYWIFSEDRNSFTVPGQAELFYNDLSPSDPKQSALLTRTLDSLRPMAVHTFYNKNKYFAINDIPCCYIKCTLDNAIPIKDQETMVQFLKDGSNEKEKNWLVVETLESGHSPFLSMPEATAKCVRRAAGEDV